MSGSMLTWLSQPGLPVPPAYNPAHLFVAHLPRVLEVLPQLRTSHNVFATIAQPLGASVYTFPLPAIALEDVADEFGRLIADTFVITLLLIALYRLTAARTTSVRRTVTLALSTLLLLWPTFLDRGRSCMISYVRAAVAFRASLMTWDMFIMRTRAEVESWSFRLVYSHLWLLPVEAVDLEYREAHGIRSTPRLTSLYKLGIALVRSVFSFALAPVFPPAQMLGQQSWFSYRINLLLMNLALYFMLSSGGALSLNAFGLVFGVEQLPMFENPFFTTSIRTFWSRWNRAIASVLHRVIFQGKNTNVRQAPEKKHEHKSPPRLDKRFFFHSLQAIMTFLVSGLLHEYLLHFSPPPRLHGSQTLFFVLNGFMTVASTYVSKFHPALVQRTPVVIRYMLLMSFFLISAPLFFIPIQANNMLAEGQCLLHHLLFPRNETPTQGTFLYYP